MWPSCYFWACFPRPGCLFLSQNLPTLIEDCRWPVRKCVETMLETELLRLLTDSDYLAKSCTEGILTTDTHSKESRRSESCSGDNNTPTPFTFSPQRIHVNKDHELFEDGDVLRHLYIQNLSTLEADDKPKLSVCEFGCHISGCSQVFSSVEEYEHHYNSLHRHVCCSCRRSLPSARLLDIHIQEWHDSLFSILAERQDMYQCLVEGCGQKFRTSKQRKDHVIAIHKYPPDFRFDKAKKDSRARDEKTAQRDTTMDVMEDVGESEGVCEEMEAMELHPSPDGETVEALHTPCSSTMETHTQVSASCHDAAATTTEQLKPRYSYRVPKTVCFGPGSVRGFRGRGRRK